MNIQEAAEQVKALLAALHEPTPENIEHIHSLIGRVTEKDPDLTIDELHQSIVGVYALCGEYQKIILKLDESLPALRVLLAAVEGQEGMILVHKEPPDALIESMAIRYDHGLGIPGYYDQEMFKGPADSVNHAKRLEATKIVMRQLYEEATGQGFYKMARHTGSGKS